MNTVNVRKMLAIIFANQKNASILMLADSIKVSRCAQSKTDLLWGDRKGKPSMFPGFSHNPASGKAGT